MRRFGFVFTVATMAAALMAFFATTGLADVGRRSSRPASLASRTLLLQARQSRRMPRSYSAVK
jgi:hypothetical protein